jgi:hypothetical protein
MSVQLTIDLPEDAFSILRTHPDRFIKEMRRRQSNGLKSVKFLKLKQQN